MAWLSDWSYRISHNLTGATGAGTDYQAWANNQLVLYQKALEDITEPRAWEY